MKTRIGLVALTLAVAILAAGCGKKAAAGASFSTAADAASNALLQSYYAGKGQWQICAPGDCAASNFDWGDDSLTYALFLRWKITQDPSLLPVLQALDSSSEAWPACNLPDCTGWSDVPLWDSIAALREYQALATADSLARGKDAFNRVDGSNAYALGACPTIDYQMPGGGTSQLKTLEVGSNYIKAALLIYEATQDQSYLTKAQAAYQAVRQYFLDPEVPLYTVFVFDDGTNCTQVPRRFYASVNGNMIWNGIHLTLATQDQSYLNQAIASAQQVAQSLGDASGVFADLQTDDDVVEPLVEAMYELAADQSQGFARDWILTNAAALTSDQTSDGAFGRFFNGPPPSTTTEWQVNGGFALTFAAAGLEPTGAMAASDAWANAIYQADDISTLPSSLQFSGRGIALMGTIGEGDGHARVFIDGTETFNGVGIRQSETNWILPLPDSVIFAWRWPASGAHTLAFQPGVTNAKEGGPFLHIQGYYVIP